MSQVKIRRRAKAITVETLRDAPAGSFLYCTKCGNRASATYGDYSFWAPTAYRFQCCRRNMRLCTSVTTYTDCVVP
jgi:hypothetical protein